MYIGSQKIMQRYDECLLKKGYSIEELVDKASDCLLPHMDKYQSFSIFCGPGNNGADGLSLALKLNNKDVHIYIMSEERLSDANHYYLNQCIQASLPVTLVTDNNLDEVIEQVKKSDVIIDAIFGFGLNGSPRGIYQAVIDEINHLYDQEIISVDIPTGLSCNTGKPYQSVISATQTITFMALKNGFLNPDSISFTGLVKIEYLDVDDVSEQVKFYELADNEMMKDIIKERKFDGHKGDYGRIGMITGCNQYKGASLLSTKAAVYTGSGVVTTISEEMVNQLITLYVPEATTVLRPPIFQKDDIAQYDALLIGSGLGLELDAYRCVIDVLSSSTNPIVIDGDALRIISSDLSLLKKQDRDIILTPHMGEFHRLIDFDDEDDLLVIAQDFAKEHHITLVLKGPYTIVTDGESSYRILAGNKAMSSGGMGDVLAGIITSLLGQGYSPLQSAMLGVYIHGKCGDRIGQNAYTVIPSKVIELIPIVMAEIKNEPKLIF